MAEMNPVGPMAPREKKLYEQEYKHGAVLFQKALHQADKSDNAYQKEQFHEVMNKALCVLNQAAQGLKREDLIEQNNKIAQDFAAYKIKPTKDVQKQLNEDLNQAKKAIS